MINASVLSYSLVWVGQEHASQEPEEELISFDSAARDLMPDPGRERTPNLRVRCLVPAGFWQSAPFGSIWGAISGQVPFLVGIWWRF